MNNPCTPSTTHARLLPYISSFNCGNRSLKSEKELRVKKIKGGGKATQLVSGRINSNPGMHSPPEHTVRAGLIKPQLVLRLYFYHTFTIKVTLQCLLWK